jgi:O-antigen/teichoic acid export membrane protein
LKHTGRRAATVATLVGTASNTLVISIQALVLIPLYLNAIGPRLYGAWLGSGDILVWMQAFDFGLPNLMIQRIGAAHGRGDSQAVGEHFGTGLFTLTLLGVTVAVLAYFLSFPLPGWMGIRGSDAVLLRQCFRVGSIATAFIIASNSVVGLARGIQDTSLVNASVVLGSLAGFGVSATLILTGWGLWAIVLGLVTRATVVLTGSAIFTVATVKHGQISSIRIGSSILREYLTISPITGLAGVSYTLMNQSASAIAAIFVRPELATIYTITRRASDVVRSLIDTIGVASYGSFAHLATSDQRQRTREVYAQIHSIRLSVAVVLAAAYISINGSLVSVWVGSEQYGGHILTILLGVQIIVVGAAYLANYLYRATGWIVRGSIALIVEALLRVPLMVGQLLLFGIAGLPLAAISTSAVAGLLANRWISSTMPASTSSTKPPSVRLWLVRAAILLTGIALAISIQRPSWVYVLIVGSSIVVVGGLALLVVDPDLRENLPVASLKRRLKSNLMKKVQAK